MHRYQRYQLLLFRNGSPILSMPQFIYSYKQGVTQVPKVNYLIVVILTYIVSMSGSVAAPSVGINEDIEKLENIRHAFEQMQGFMTKRPDLFPARISFQ